MYVLKRAKVLMLVLSVMICLLLVPTFALAGGTQNSDVAQNIFVYVKDVNNNQVLLKVISLDTLKDMAHGSDGTAESTYYGSFIDSFKTPTYLEGRGVTISEFLDYVLATTTVQNADALTYSGSDRLFFICSDGASIGFTADELLGVDRYYFPALYDNWHQGNLDEPESYVTDVSTVLASGISAPPYLATDSEGGRVLISEGNSISSHVAANGGVVSGCLTDYLTDTDALRLIFPQTEDDITNSTQTFSDIKKWVNQVLLREDATSPITSLGEISDPTCTYTLDGTTLTITMSCEDEGASIYYSTIGGYTTVPVNLYTGPITIEDYDISNPFSLGLMAVEEGYESSGKVLASSADYVDSNAAPSFTYDLAASDLTPEVDQSMTLSATLAADKDYTLYGAEYRMVVPASFIVDVVRTGDGWEYGTATNTDDETVVTFTYLDIAGSAVTADSQVPVGSVTLRPSEGGDATITVSEAIVTKSDATGYTNITAEDLDLTVEGGSSVLLGDVDGDGYIAMGDALQVCQAVANVIVLTDEEKEAADVDGDGYISMGDALMICQYVAEVITEF